MGSKVDMEESGGEDRLIELITHLAGCTQSDAIRALEAVGPGAEGLSAVARALSVLQQGQA